MPIASDNNFPKVIFDGQASTPSNPASGFYKLYFKDDGILYSLNSAGNETEVGAGAGSASYNKTATMWYDEFLVTAGTSLTRHYDTNQRYNTYTRFSTAADGDTTTNGFVIAAGTYTINILGMINRFYAKTDIYIDSTNIGSLDWYNGSLSYNEIKQISSVVITEGYHLFKIVVNGRNASAADWQVPLTKIWLTPSAF